MMSEINLVSNDHAIMYEENYKGIHFKVCFLRGGYFTAYLDVTHTKLAFIDYNNIDLPVHWGLTYSNSRYPWESNESFRTWIIGWDYGHCDDAYENDLSESIFKESYTPKHSIGYEHHTLEEIIEDCMKAIDYIKED